MTIRTPADIQAEIDVLSWDMRCIESRYNYAIPPEDQARFDLLFKRRGELGDELHIANEVKASRALTAMIERVRRVA